MLAAETNGDATHPEERLPDDLMAVGSFRTTKDGFDHSLVVVALGYDCWLMPADGGYQLVVQTSVAPRVRAELAKFERESADWPPRPATDPLARTRLDLVTPLLWALAVLVVYCGQLRHRSWTEAGALEPVAVFGRGEWWRALTALFLHADEGHLASNLLAGVFVFAAVLSVFGRVRGWLLLGVASVIGNLAVAAMHYPGPYRSLGASTAIFAALGLLTGRAVRLAANRGSNPHRWRSFFVPAAAGLTILALYGAGAPPVDVLAHVTGFVAGLVVSLVAPRSRTPKADGTGSIL